MAERGATILLVEDDADLREVVLDTLELEGYPAMGAPEGGAALELLRSAETKPLLIFLDLMMPGMNGTEFRQAQLQDPAVASIPVILLSAHADIEARAKALEVAGFLRKPVKLEMLLEVAEQFAGEGASGR